MKRVVLLGVALLTPACGEKVEEPTPVVDTQITPKMGVVVDNGVTWVESKVGTFVTAAAPVVEPPPPPEPIHHGRGWGKGGKK